MKEEKVKSFVDELDEAVRLINYDIAEQTGFEWVFVTMMSSGDAYVVKFLDIEVWSSENDDRPYLREDGSSVDYEADDYDPSWVRSIRNAF